MSSRPARVLLVGLGAVPSRLLAEARDALRGQLAVEAQAGPSLDRPAYALNEPRGQYHAPAILRRLAGLRGSVGGAPVLGLADVDLFVPDAAFVLAEVDRDAGAAVVSMKRLGAAEPNVVARRVRAEAVAAGGQLLGLSPCRDYRCAMYVSVEAADADRKGPGLCGACRSALAI